MLTSSDLIYLGMLIFVMLSGFVLVFLLRTHIDRQHLGYKSRQRSATDSSLISSGLGRKHQRFLKRLEKEKQQKKLLEEEEAAQSAGHVYPTHTTKEEWLNKEYHVGEEKETHYPDIAESLGKKDSD